jgi:hypothetical protein
MSPLIVDIGASMNMNFDDSIALIPIARCMTDWYQLHMSNVLDSELNLRIRYYISVGWLEEVPDELGSAHPCTQGRGI